MKQVGRSWSTRVEGLEQRRQVVAAEIVHQRGQLVVGALLDQRA